MNEVYSRVTPKKDKRGERQSCARKAVPACVQPAAHRLYVAQDGYECNPTQNCKFT